MDIIKYNPIYKKQIPELFTNTIHKTCNKDYTKGQLEAWASLNIDYEKWENRLNKTKPYLAILDKKLVGFVEFYEDYIDCFYVHEDYQGIGVGKAMLCNVLSLAKDKKLHTLRVDASITAKPFFERFGFTQLNKNVIKRANEELINYSLKLELK